MFGLSDIAVKLILAGVGAAALVGMIGGGIHHIQTLAREKQIVEQNARIMEQAKKDAEKVAKEKEVEAKEARTRELAAQARATAAAKERDKFKNELRKLETADPVVREWASTRVPDAVVRCVLGLADCAASGNQPNRTTEAAGGAVTADSGADYADGRDHKSRSRNVWSSVPRAAQGLQRRQGVDVGLVPKATADRDHRSSGSKAATGAAVIQ